jgi:hypothetical protein
MEKILYKLMTVLRSECALIVGTIYSSRHGLPWLLLMTSSSILLLPSYFNCTPTAVTRKLRNFVNNNRIKVRPLVADSHMLLYIANGMALSSRNVYAKYKILGVPGFEISKTEIVSVRYE